MRQPSINIQALPRPELLAKSLPSMKSKITSLAVLIVVLLAGCATADKLNSIHIGMSKDEVVSLLGKPDSTSAQANVEYLTYYLENDANYGRDQPYMIRVVDGKVE